MYQPVVIQAHDIYREVVRLAAFTEVRVSLASVNSPLTRYAGMVCQRLVDEGVFALLLLRLSPAN